ncbi:MAG TPA: hypothetical protein GX504_01805 [Clostridia bacterium]|nr:hypothetical protein [Clostridia bacterium]
MKDFRCQCKKIVFQIEGDTIIIKCRHCKRYIHIRTKGLIDVQYKLDPTTTQVDLSAVKS